MPLGDQGTLGQVQRTRDGDDHNEDGKVSAKNFSSETAIDGDILMTYYTERYYDLVDTNNHLTIIYIMAIGTTITIHFWLLYGNLWEEKISLIWVQVYFV